MDAELSALLRPQHGQAERLMPQRERCIVEVGTQRRLLEYSRAVRIGEDDTTDRGRPEQPRHACGTGGGDVEWIDATVLDPPVDHVDAFQLAEGAQPHPAVAYHEVGTLDGIEPELGSEIRVLDIRIVVVTAAEHHDAGAVDPGEADQGAVQRADRRADRSDPLAGIDTERFGKGRAVAARLSTA